MFTREFTREAVDACNGDAAHLERAKLMSGNFIVCATDTPDGKDVMVSYTFDKGRVAKYEFEEEDAPSSLRERRFTPMRDGLARVTAHYATFAKLDRGEMEAADALNSPDYKIEGNMIMLMPLMQAVDSWTRKLRAMPKDYE
jgi:hypothetical protein